MGENWVSTSLTGLTALSNNTVPTPLTAHVTIFHGSQSPHFASCYQPLLELCGLGIAWKHESAQCSARPHAHCEGDHTFSFAKKLEGFPGLKYIYHWILSQFQVSLFRKKTGFNNLQYLLSPIQSTLIFEFLIILNNSDKGWERLVSILSAKGVVGRIKTP